MPPLILQVARSRESDGRKAYSTRGQLFDGTVDGRLIGGAMSLMSKTEREELQRLVRQRAEDVAHIADPTG